MEITRKEINKINIPFRIIAAGGALIGVLGIVLFGVLIYIDQNYWFLLLVYIPFGLFIYGMGISAITGYPPKCLYFASSEKECIKK